MTCRRSSPHLLAQIASAHQAESPSVDKKSNYTVRLACRGYGYLLLIAVGCDDCCVFLRNCRVRAAGLGRKQRGRRCGQLERHSRRSRQAVACESRPREYKRKNLRQEDTYNPHSCLTPNHTHPYTLDFHVRSARTKHIALSNS